MDANEFYKGMYSTTLECKRQTLTDLVGSEVSVRDVADTLSDAAGGGEQLLYGDLAYGVDAELVSPLWSDHAGCTYAYVQWEWLTVVRATTVTIRPSYREAEDSVLSLAYAYGEARDSFLESQTVDGDVF